MTFRHSLIAVALIVATAAVTTHVVSQNQNEPPPRPEMSPEELEMMQKWEEFMTPGDGHARLAFKVGKWNGVIKHWMDPNQPEPVASEGTSEYRWIMGGRYLHNKTTSQFFDMPFHGEAWEGYDNLKKKHTWVWIDNFGTGLMVAEGTYDDATKTFTFTYEHPDLHAGKYSKGRSTERIIDNDHFVGAMYGPGPDGKEFKMMEITYTRAK